jgi:hypothetical protein
MESGESLTLASCQLVNFAYSKQDDETCRKVRCASAVVVRVEKAIVREEGLSAFQISVCESHRKISGRGSARWDNVRSVRFPT